MALFVHVSVTDKPAGEAARPLGAAGAADWAGKVARRTAQARATLAVDPGADASAA